MNEFESLLSVVRNRSYVELANGALFTIAPARRMVIRANYDGIALIMKILMDVFVDDGLVSHGVMSTPRQLLKMRTHISQMRLDALRLGAVDAATSLSQLSDSLIEASDGNSNTVAVVYSDPERPLRSACIEQEYLKHVRDYELNEKLGGALFSVTGLHCPEYEKAARSLVRIGYKRHSIIRKVFGKIARDDAGAALRLSKPELIELRKRCRSWIIDLEVTPQHYAEAYADIGPAQARDIKEYEREYAAANGPNRIGSKACDVSKLPSPVPDDSQMVVDRTTSKKVDELLSDGWIVSGDLFKRLRPSEGIPVRIRLKDFSLSNQQRRTLRKNTDLRIEIKDLEITKKECDLFENYKPRLRKGGLESIFEIVPEASSNKIKTFTVTEGDRLIAASFLVVGNTATYSMFAMFEPSIRWRSLGILTILKEVEYSTAAGKELYYLAQTYEEPSYYDYKKRFHGLEAFDWNGKWTKFPRLTKRTTMNRRVAMD
jgi:arginyl-tRNA--protein-N-Asp/Glu arginylyltransferase